MKSHRTIELLAPAGSFDAARAAVNAGADAVYMGGPLFSARAYAESSRDGAAAGKAAAPVKRADLETDGDMLMETMEFCHLRGVRVYMTLNILMKDREMEMIEDYLTPYYMAGLDGVIIQDIGLLGYVRKHFPRLPLHASTQMTVTGPYMARMLRDYGVERVVPARELDLKEIRTIADIPGLSVEVFAHGALCYCYSGQCLMSSCIGGRSGNRGRCAGPCRLPYDGDRYLLSMKDLNTLYSLPELYLAGVDSLKIEGRMKSPLYVAGVTSVYRKYLDRLCKELSLGGEDCLKDLAVRKSLEPEKEDLRILSEIFDRGGSTDGYLYRRNGSDMLQLRERPELRIRDEAVMEHLTERYLRTDRKLRTDVRARLIPGERPRLTLTLVQGQLPEAGDEAPPSVTVFGDQEVAFAKNRPMTREELMDRLSRTGDSGFFADHLDIETEGDIFVSVGQLNALRRKAQDELRKLILSGFCRDRGTV